MLSAAARSTSLRALAPLGNRWMASIALAPVGPHIKVEVKDDIGLIRLDMADSRMNVLSQAVMQDFLKALDKLDGAGVKAAVITSDKPDFIAGADINMLAAAKSAKELQDLSTAGQQVMDRISGSKYPIVAAINGTCAGGGLEVALACSARVASSSPRTALSLPEVMLGLLPGAGGTQRLPALVGLRSSLDIALTGKSIRPDRARKMKLVDVIADPNALESAAVLVATQLAEGKKPFNRELPLLDRILQSTSFTRNYVYDQAKKTIQKNTHGNYPAPPLILDAIKTGIEQGRAAGLAREAESFGRLGMTPESKALVSLFFGKTALKKNRFGKPQHSYNTVAVIGAGLMGAGIAQVSAEKAGMRVLLKDRDNAGLARGEQQIYKNLDTKVKRKSMSALERDVIMSRVIGITNADPTGDAKLRKADMVIEAVFEDLKVKHQVIQQLETLVPEHCVVASNTSALPIADIAAGSKRPQNVVGMHYFSPVDKMELLEVITHEKTSKEASAAAVDVGIRQGKVVIVVKDGPGFYTTRILSPFMVEAGALLQEGHGIKEIDQAMRKFGFPVGPITLFDEVGIDVGNHIQPTLIKAFGERMAGANTAMMTEMVDRKWAGRKTGKGFFVYNGKKKEINPEVEELIKKYQTAPTKLELEDLQHRVAYRMINEALYCLQDGTLQTPTDGDIGAVFGLGFPPFHGGPFRYVDTIGAQKVLDTMNRLRSTYGDRFAPAQVLVDYAKGGKKFHP